MSTPSFLYIKWNACFTNKKSFLFPIVLIRGLGRHLDFWLSFVSELQLYGDVITIDLLGTGQSADFWGRSCVSDFAKDVFLTLKKNNIHSCHVLGISFGGMVALQMGQMSRLFDCRLLSLSILCSSSRGFSMKRINSKALIQMFLSFRHGIPLHKDFGHFLVSKNFLSKTPDLNEKWDFLWRKYSFSSFALFRQLFAAAKFKFSYQEALFDMPVHFLVSQDDHLVPWKNSLALWKKVPSASLSIFKEYGHDLTTEDPVFFAEVISRFIELYETQCLSSGKELLNV